MVYICIYHKFLLDNIELKEGVGEKRTSHNIQSLDSRTGIKSRTQKG